METFAERLAESRLSQADLAVAFLWQVDTAKPGVSVPVKDLARWMHDKALCSKVNVTRLAKQLAAHPDTVRGDERGTFRIKAASRSSLDERYGSFGQPRAPRQSDSLIPASPFASRRIAWSSLVRQINGCYDVCYFDASAVLCRRLVESLIVEAFRAKNAEAAIRVGGSGDFFLMEGLVGVLSSGKYIRLSRSGRAALEPIRTLGNTAAHSPHYVTTKQDMDGISRDARMLISELLNVIDGK